MEHTNRKRRNFMLAFGLGMAGAAAALFGGRRTDTPEPAPTAAAPEPVKGYHVSEHVKRYYRSTRV